MAHYIDVDRDGPISAIGVPFADQPLELPRPPRLPVDLPLQLRATPPVAAVRPRPSAKVIAIALAVAGLVIAIVCVLA